MRLYELLNEAPVRDIDRSKTFYHGTNQESAKKIMKQGIHSFDVVGVDRGNNNLTPVKGRVYVTPKIGYATIYAIGGDYGGTDSNKDGFGYVFQIDGKKLVDVQPDEDSVSEITYKNLKDSKFNHLHYLIKSSLTPKQYHKWMDGDYNMWAHAGKKIMKHIGPTDMHILLDHGAHIAHGGSLQPDGYWKFNLKKISKLNRDYSNFFELAKYYTIK